jgi:histidine triad (HIT) family protein
MARRSAGRPVDVFTNAASFAKLRFIPSAQSPTITWVARTPAGHDNQIWGRTVAYDTNNVFAKILRGELPKVAVYEDEHTLAFMDIMPAVEGHIMVIPKEPGVTIFDISPEAAAAAIRTTQKVAAAVKKALGVPGIMLAQLNGPESGQTIPHVHFHILPRRAGADMSFHGRTMQKPEVLEAVAAKIRAAL